MKTIIAALCLFAMAASAQNLVNPVWLPATYYTVNVTLAPTSTSNLAVNGAVLLPLYVQTNTPTIADLGYARGGRQWCSNGFFFITGSTNGTTVYTKLLAP